MDATLPTHNNHILCLDVSSSAAYMPHGWLWQKIEVRLRIPLFSFFLSFSSFLVGVEDANEMGSVGVRFEH